MALNSFLNSNNADTNYFQKMIGYQIQKTYTRFVLKSSSLFLLFLPFSPVLAFLRVFFLAIATGVEVIKTDTSFWIFFLQILYEIMTFPPTIKVFNLGNILFFLFKNDISIYSREIMAATLFLSSTVPKNFLVVLIFHISLALMGRLLPTRHISKRRVMRLIFLRVFFLGWSMPAEVLGIYLLST